MASPSSTRWTTIDRATLGRPCAYLDALGKSTVIASATIITVPSEDLEHPLYRPILHHHESPVPIPRFHTLQSAKDWTERQIQPPLNTIPLNIFPEWWVTTQHEPQPGEILISITEPGQPPITPHGSYAAIHRIGIWDIPSTINHPTLGTLHPFSQADARDLIHFLLKQRHRMTALTLHCHAGVSRSPAIAIAISEWMQTTPNIIELIERFPAFNRTLYRTLCHVAIEEDLLKIGSTEESPALHTQNHLMQHALSSILNIAVAHTLNPRDGYAVIEDWARNTLETVTHSPPEPIRTGNSMTP